MPTPVAKDFYVGEGVALNERHRVASVALDMKPNKKRPGAEQQKAGAEVARRYYDVRAFGAVMSTGDNPAGQLRGPIQIACPITSVEPVQPSELTITRVAVTREEDLQKLVEDKEGGKDREMGSKHLYRMRCSTFRALSPRHWRRRPGSMTMISQCSGMRCSECGHSIGRRRGA
jgi:Cas7 group CRISPR-associated protein Csh2